jgi:biopolymer transport protein ExbD
MAAGHGGFDSAEPNLTPMLDLVFQLITFFMLVINFKGATSDLTVKLPVLGSAVPLDWHGPFEPLVLNVDTAGQVTVYGAPVDIEKHVAFEARLIRDRLPDDEQVKKGELPVPVVIRADRAVPFHLLNRVIKTCQGHGYRQFSLSAMTREEER